MECAKVLGLPSMPILGHEKVPLVEKPGFQAMMRLHVEESELGSPFQTCIWSAPFFRRKKESGLKMLLIYIFHRVQKNISYLIFFSDNSIQSHGIFKHILPGPHLVASFYNKSSAISCGLGVAKRVKAHLKNWFRVQAPPMLFSGSCLKTWNLKPATWNMTRCKQK